MPVSAPAVLMMLLLLLLEVVCITEVQHRAASFYKPRLTFASSSVGPAISHSIAISTG